MSEELNPLNEHDLIQFLTGWGINRAGDLANAICQRCGVPKPEPEVKEVSVEEIEDLIVKVLSKHHVTRDHKINYHFGLACYLAQAIVNHLKGQE